MAVLDRNEGASPAASGSTGFLKRHWRGVALTAALLAVPLGITGWLARGSGDLLGKGEKAPLFALADQTGRSHRLADYAGRPVLLVFYPGADPDSVESLRSLRDWMPHFDELGVKVFAVSRGETIPQRPFHEAEKLNFPLLSDPDGKVTSEFGVNRDEDGRTAFVLGPRGTVVQTVAHVQPSRQGEQLATLTKCCFAPTRSQASRLLGRPVEDIRLPRAADGKPESLYGPGEHAATVLFFISAECPCSRGYDARLRSLAEDYGHQGVRFVAVNSNAGETREAMAAHAREAGFPFPVLQDPGHKAADRLGAKVTPEVFVMDRDRKLRYHGRIDDSRKPEEVRSNDLRNALDALVAGQKPLKAHLGPFGCAIARAEHR